jgi:hypothetical protein
LDKSPMFLRELACSRMFTGTGQEQEGNKSVHAGTGRNRPGTGGNRQEQAGNRQEQAGTGIMSIHYGLCVPAGIHL